MFRHVGYFVGTLERAPRFGDDTPLSNTSSSIWYVSVATDTGFTAEVNGEDRELEKGLTLGWRGPSLVPSLCDGSMAAWIALRSATRMELSAECAFDSVELPSADARAANGESLVPGINFLALRSLRITAALQPDAVVFEVGGSFHFATKSSVADSDCAKPDTDGACLTVDTSVAIGFTAASIILRFDFEMHGTWFEPLGLKNFAVANPKFKLGVQIYAAGPKPLELAFNIELFWRRSGDWPGSLLEKKKDGDGNIISPFPDACSGLETRACFAPDQTDEKRVGDLFIFQAAFLYEENLPVPRFGVSFRMTAISLSDIVNMAADIAAGVVGLAGESDPPSRPTFPDGIDLFLNGIAFGFEFELSTVAEGVFQRRLYLFGSATVDFAGFGGFYFMIETELRLPAEADLRAFVANPLGELKASIKFNASVTLPLQLGEATFYGFVSPTKFEMNSSLLIDLLGFGIDFQAGIIASDRGFDTRLYARAELGDVGAVFFYGRLSSDTSIGLHVEAAVDLQFLLGVAIAASVEARLNEAEIFLRIAGSVDLGDLIGGAEFDGSIDSGSGRMSMQAAIDVDFLGLVSLCGEVKAVAGGSPQAGHYRRIPQTDVAAACSAAPNGRTSLGSCKDYGDCKDRCESDSNCRGYVERFSVETLSLPTSLEEATAIKQARDDNVASWDNGKIYFRGSHGGPTQLFYIEMAAPTSPPGQDSAPTPPSACVHDDSKCSSCSDSGSEPPTCSDGYQLSNMFSVSETRYACYPPQCRCDKLVRNEDNVVTCNDTVPIDIGDGQYTCCSDDGVVLSFFMIKAASDTAPQAPPKCLGLRDDILHMNDCDGRDTQLFTLDTSDGDPTSDGIGIGAAGAALIRIKSNTDDCLDYNYTSFELGLRKCHGQSNQLFFFDVAQAEFPLVRNATFERLSYVGPECTTNTPGARMFERPRMIDTQYSLQASLDLNLGFLGEFSFNGEISNDGVLLEAVGEFRKIRERITEAIKGAIELVLGTSSAASWIRDAVVNMLTRTFGIEQLRLLLDTRESVGNKRVELEVELVIVGLAVRIGANIPLSGRSRRALEAIDAEMYLRLPLVSARMSSEWLDEAKIRRWALGEGEKSDASKCIDADLRSSCMSSVQSDPWIRIDMGQTQNLSSVLIYNREGVCGSLLGYFEIWVSAGGPYTQCAAGGDQGRAATARRPLFAPIPPEEEIEWGSTTSCGSGINPGPEVLVPCAGQARYVEIRLPGSARILDLRDVSLLAQRSSSSSPRAQPRNALFAPFAVSMESQTDQDEWLQQAGEMPLLSAGRKCGAGGLAINDLIRLLQERLTFRNIVAWLFCPENPFEGRTAYESKVGERCRRNCHCENGQCGLVGNRDAFECCRTNRFYHIDTRFYCEAQMKVGESCRRDRQCENGQCGRVGNFRVDGHVFECCKTRKFTHADTRDYCAAQMKVGERCRRDSQCESGACGRVGGGDFEHLQCCANGKYTRWFRDYCNPPAAAGEVCTNGDNSGCTNGCNAVSNSGCNVCGRTNSDVNYFICCSSWDVVSGVAWCQNHEGGGCSGEDLNCQKGLVCAQRTDTDGGDGLSGYRCCRESKDGRCRNPEGSTCSAGHNLNCEEGLVCGERTDGRNGYMCCREYRMENNVAVCLNSEGSTCIDGRNDDCGEGLVCGARTDGGDGYRCCREFKVDGNGVALCQNPEGSACIDGNNENCEGDMVCGVDMRYDAMFNCGTPGRRTSRPVFPCAFSPSQRTFYKCCSDFLMDQQRGVSMCPAT